MNTRTHRNEAVAVFALLAALVVALVLVAAGVPAAPSAILVTGAVLAGWFTVATTTGLGL